jgi:Amiloride-sensitive sodium channel
MIIKCCSRNSVFEFSDILYNQTLSVIDQLNQTRQFEFLSETAFATLKYRWNAPLQVILTKWGFCYSFNLMPLSELLNLNKYESFLSKNDFGLQVCRFFSCSVQLDFEPELVYFKKQFPYLKLLEQSFPFAFSSNGITDRFYFSFHEWNNWSPHMYKSESWIGCQFIVHSNYELPSETSFINYHYFHYYYNTIVNIFPKQILISDELRQMSVKRRRCYVENERKLELFKVYSKQNCEHECQSLALADRCGCVPFYLLSENFLIRPNRSMI